MRERRSEPVERPPHFLRVLMLSYEVGNAHENRPDTLIPVMSSSLKSEPALNERLESNGENRRDGFELTSSCSATLNGNENPARNDLPSSSNE